MFARKLAARGCDLVLVARRKDRLDALAGELAREHNICTEVLPADLACDGDLLAVERRIEGEQNLEYLINNAGFGTLDKFYEGPVEPQDRMHRVHIMATMRLTHAALPGMVVRGRGGIVNVSSVAAFFQSARNVSYCATKCWINSFTEGVWLELKSARSPVNVQALCPGYTYTEFHDVLGVKRDMLSRSFWMPADFVVSESLRGLDRGRLFVIPGWRYRLIVRFMSSIPGNLRRRLLMKADPRNRRKPVD